MQALAPNFRDGQKGKYKPFISTSNEEWDLFQACNILLKGCAEYRDNKLYVWGSIYYLTKWVRGR